mgnify:FL=1
MLPASGAPDIMPDSRKTDRFRSLLRGHVVFNGGASTYDCIVRNVSPAGARLDMADSVALPTEFDLDIPHRGRVFRVRIVWRSEGQVGVEMIGQPPAPTALAPASDADRVDQLMRENARLKAQVLELQQRVAQLSEA